MLATHGGMRGEVNEDLHKAALPRPRQRWAREPGIDLAALAAAYAYGLARNHPYPDGNKRVAFVVMVVFPGLNGQDLEADETDVVRTFLSLAAGGIAEDGLAEWVRGHTACLREPHG